MVQAKTLGFLLVMGTLSVLYGAPLEANAGPVSPESNATETTQSPSNSSESSTPAQYTSTMEDPGSELANSSSVLNATTMTAPLIRRKRQREIPPGGEDLTDFTTPEPTETTKSEANDYYYEAEDPGYKRETTYSPSTSSEPSNNTSPELSNNTSPELSNNTIPELSNNTSPELSNTTSPELSNNTSPELSNNTSPELSNNTSDSEVTTQPAAEAREKRQSMQSLLAGQNLSVIHLPENLSPSNMESEDLAHMKRFIRSTMSSEQNVSTITPDITVSDSTSFSPRNESANSETMISETTDSMQSGDEIKSNSTNTTSTSTPIPVTQAVDLTTIKN